MTTTALACTKMRRAAAALRTAKLLDVRPGAVRVPCSDASHEHVKLTAWSSLRNSRPWLEAGLEIAECEFCNSSLCRPLGEEEAA